MKCDVSSGQKRVRFHEMLAESVCTFLKWASMSGLLSHISVRRTTDVWRTPAEQADGRRVSDALYRLNHHCSSTCSDYRMPVFVLKVDVKREKWLKKWFRLHRHESALKQIGNRKGNNLYSDYYKWENQVKNRVCVFLHVTKNSIKKKRHESIRTAPFCSFTIRCGQSRPTRQQLRI